LLITLVVSLSNHERNRFVQRFLKLTEKSALPCIHRQFFKPQCRHRLTPQSCLIFFVWNSPGERGSWVLWAWLPKWWRRLPER